MGSFGGFYKGEKKKQKKGKEFKSNSSSYTITLPEIVSKKKKDNF